MALRIVRALILITMITMAPMVQQLMEKGGLDESIGVCDWEEARARSLIEYFQKLGNSNFPNQMMSLGGLKMSQGLN